MPFFTYILFSDTKNKFYIGYTSDLNARIERHNAGGNPSTKSGRPWKIVYHEEFSTSLEAKRREKQIKAKKSRAYIEQLICSAG